ncbi:MAG TPA: response regulator, partial [Acidobacteriota bacterium]|nr:response regulator [Acidobacteriota bacterium]
RILVVEDNPEMRSFLLSLLPEFGLVGYECCDGMEAVESYERIHPDMVLMDLELPRLDGLAATRRICSHDPTAWVVIVTNFADERVRQAAQAAGARDFIDKENLGKLWAMLGQQQVLGELQGHASGEFPSVQVPENC